MLNLFDRGFFRTELYNRKSSEDELIDLILELDGRLKEVYDNTEFKKLNASRQMSVLDQYYTSLETTWTNFKLLVINKNMRANEEEKNFNLNKRKENKVIRKQNKKLNIRDKIQIRPTKEYSGGLFDKKFYKNSLNEIKQNKAFNKYMFLDLILELVERMEETIECEKYNTLNPLQQRQQKDLYLSAMTECWKEFRLCIINENPQCSAYKKMVEKAKHIEKRRERHKATSERKRSWKELKSELIKEMESLPYDELIEVQKELEIEYRTLRNLPLTPEV